MIFPSVRSDPITEGRRLGKFTNAVMKMTEGSRQEGSSSPDIGFVSGAARSREAKVRRLVFATEKSAAKLTSISWQSSQKQINADLEHHRYRAVAGAHLSYFLAPHLKGALWPGSAVSE